MRTPTSMRAIGGHGYGVASPHYRRSACRQASNDTSTFLPMASGLHSRTGQNLCQPAEFLLRPLFSRGCRDKAVPHGTTPPATQGDRRRAAVVGRALQTRLVVHCYFGGRCNQCRTLSAIWSVGRLPSPSSTLSCTSYLPGAMRLCTACTSTGGSMAAVAQTRPPRWPSALRLHRGERLRYVHDFGAHVHVHVGRPSCIALRVHEKVQFDRLQPMAADGYVAEQYGALLAPGVTQLQLGKGLYHFRTLNDAQLRVLAGGVQVASTSVAGKDNWPERLRTPTVIRAWPLVCQVWRARRCINASHRPPSPRVTGSNSVRSSPPWRGGCDVSCTCHRSGTRRLAWNATPCPSWWCGACHLPSQGGQPLAVLGILCNLLKTQLAEKVPRAGIDFAFSERTDAPEGWTRARQRPCNPIGSGRAM